MTRGRLDEEKYVAVNHSRQWKGKSREQKREVHIWGKRINNVADEPMIRSAVDAAVAMDELAMTGGDNLFPGKHRESIAKNEIGAIQMAV